MESDKSICSYSFAQIHSEQPENPDLLKLLEQNLKTCLLTDDRYIFPSDAEGFPTVNTRIYSAQTRKR
jgi:hypothetical protein